MSVTQRFKPGKVKFPKFRDELLAMLDQDQKEVRAQARFVRAWSANSGSESVVRRKRIQLSKNCRARADRMLRILEVIEAPTIDKIGVDASQAVSVVALHSSLSIMKKVLAIFAEYYQKDRANIYYQAIPSLTDRIMILEGKKQSFGTQWLPDKNGNWFLYPVEDFARMNERRAAYGLGGATQPRDLSLEDAKQPWIAIAAKESDQQQPTKEDYGEYSRDYLN